jgi:hypothetical protein
MDAYFQSWAQTLGENTTADFAITTTVQLGSVFPTSASSFLMKHMEMVQIIKAGWFLPSGKRLHNYGKSPFLMAKLTINHHFQ